MMPNFDEAIRATEEMFANERAEQESVPPVAEEVPVTEEPIAEESVPTTEEPPADQSTLNDAIETAEVAAQVASEKDAQLQQLMAEMEELRQQNQTMQGTIDELSRKNEEALIEEAMLPPELDINGLAFADEETQKAKMAEFAEAMSAYNRKHIMDELAPTLEYAKKGMQEAEKAEVLETLSQVPELAGIMESIPQLDRIIANNKWLQSDDMPMEEKYINAFIII